MTTLSDLEKQLLAAFQKALEDTAVTIEAKAKAAAPYDTGNLRDSIQAETLSEYEYQVTANTSYALPVHEGYQRAGTFVQGKPYLSQPFEEEKEKIAQRIKENL